MWARGRSWSAQRVCRTRGGGASVAGRAALGVLAFVCVFALSEHRINARLPSETMLSKSDWLVAAPNPLPTTSQRGVVGEAAAGAAPGHSATVPPSVVMISKHSWADFYDHEPPSLVNNVARTRALHAQAKFFWLDDADCVALLERTGRHDLARAFEREPFGPYKSDLCRVAFLHEHGGIYMDCDMQCETEVATRFVRHSLVTAIEIEPAEGVFQSILASAPGHPVLRWALALYEDFYAGRHALEHGTTAGTSIFRSALDRAGRDAGLPSWPRECLAGGGSMHHECGGVTYCCNHSACGNAHARPVTCRGRALRGCVCAAPGVSPHLLREVFDPAVSAARRAVKTALGARGCDIVVADDYGTGDVLFRSHVLYSEHCHPVWPLPGSLWLVGLPYRAWKTARDTYLAWGQQATRG